MFDKKSSALASAGTYVFRGDDNFLAGPVGQPLGSKCEIDNPADHVLRKESKQTSRYMSFTEEVRIARRFTSFHDNSKVLKVKMSVLRELESHGIIKVWDSDTVGVALRNGPKKIARQAADVRSAMARNREILIEGQIPAQVIERTN